MNHVGWDGSVCQAMSGVYFGTLRCPSGDKKKEKKRRDFHMNRFQLLFSWLAAFSLTPWLGEQDFPCTISGARNGRAGNSQRERIKVLKKTLWVQFLGFLFWLVACGVWSSAPKEMWGGEEPVSNGSWFLPSSFPRWAPGCRWCSGVDVGISL